MWMGGGRMKIANGTGRRKLFESEIDVLMKSKWFTHTHKEPHHDRAFVPESIKKHFAFVYRISRKFIITTIFFRQCKKWILLTGHKCIQVQHNPLPATPTHTPQWSSLQVQFHPFSSFSRHHQHHARTSTTTKVGSSLHLCIIFLLKSTIQKTATTWQWLKC